MTAYSAAPRFVSAEAVRRVLDWDDVIARLKHAYSQAQSEHERRGAIRSINDWGIVERTVAGLLHGITPRISVMLGALIELLFFLNEAY